MLFSLLVASLWYGAVLSAQTASEGTSSAGAGLLQPQQENKQLFAAQTSGGLEEAELISAVDGWARSDSQLMFTSDQGHTWKEITPEGGQGLKIAKVLFTSPVQGWILRQNRGTNQGNWTLLLSATSDQGRSWRNLPTIAMTEQAQRLYYGGADLSFIDAQRGWMVLKQTTGSAFCGASLYKTEDGGQSWQELPNAPVCEAPVFSDGETGYARELPRGNAVLKTSDGGRSWTSLKLPAPPVANVNVLLSDLRVNGQQITLMRTLSDLNGPVRADQLRSSDGGSTWSVDDQLSTPSPASSERTTTKTPGLDVQAYWGTADSLTIKAGGDSHAALLPPTWAKTRFSVKAVSFFNASSGWLTINGTQCSTTGCIRGNHLLITNDGGKTLFKSVVPFVSTHIPTAPKNLKLKKVVPYSTSISSEHGLQPSVRDGPGGTFAVVVIG